MKVILNQDIGGLGRKSEIRQVSDGYASNYLLPRKLASLATESAVKRIESEKKQQRSEKELHVKLLEKSLEDISGEEFHTVRKASPEGHLFAGIHADEIMKVIQKAKNIEIPESFIELEKPLKETGSHKIFLSVGKKRIAFTLVVEGKE